DAILVVEWAQRIADALPEDRFEITITHAKDTERTIMISAPKDRDIQLDNTDAPLCRACNAAIAQNSKHFPFCSNRCRMSDLNKWFSGDYKISREIKDADLDALD
ncbi:MAG: DNA gyrase inhibitor YacG, partial [Phycisphaerales bacterium]|nr:DNA gyrase inhibitor YacG [Phycisphaerales bacterium]